MYGPYHMLTYKPQPNLFWVCCPQHRFMARPLPQKPRNVSILHMARPSKRSSPNEDVWVFAAQPSTDTRFRLRRNRSFLLGFSVYVSMGNLTIHVELLGPHGHTGPMRP